MVDSPALKRKREGAEPLRKKVKTRGKGDAAVQGSAEEDVQTPKIATTPAKPKDGANEQISTPAPSKAAKKKAGKQNAGIATPVSSGKKSKGPMDATKSNGPEPSPSKKAAGETQALVKTEPDASKAAKAQQPRAARSNQKKKSVHPWTWSGSMGGWFLPEDPVFTSDEKYLILSNAKALQIYATDTSTLARALPMRSGFISTYALSATDAKHIYTADAAGLITLWDWSEGRTVGRWDIGSNVRSITVVPDSTSTADLVYTHEMGTSHTVNVHALRTKQQTSQTELKQIFKTKTPITGMRVLQEGKIVVVSFQKSIMVGRRSKSADASLQDLKYVWREFQTSKRVTAFDAYVRTPEQSATKGERPTTEDDLDLAMGDQDGAIWVFEDILSSFARIEKAQKDGAKGEADQEALRPKRLHWHREAVASVKWSKDGNYLISGGAETVLVIWQLSTGKQQHLPHLTAAIENIVVSPTGASYSITLANNSVVVLSTAELEAKMNVLGVQSRRVDLEQFPRESTLSKYSFDIFGQIPMTVDPKNPSQVLFSVPSSQPHHGGSGIRPAPYMQTFDIANQHTVSRQALTRNNATDPNMGPDGRKISEPNVTFLQTSSDGKWLATVDEWIPPYTDLGYLDEGVPDFNAEERTLRRETYLKFWQWDDKSSQWILESRIDAPHFLEAVGANARVLDLVADPAGTGFATIGDDRSVRIWKPKTRTRDGITVRGADKTKAGGLITWSLYRSVKLSSNLDVLGPTQSDPELRTPQHSRLAFSPDGSVLAAGVSDSDSGVIHIIDALAGTIRRSITELDFTMLSSLGILNRHLIVVGRSVAVWDLVLDELVYCIPEGSWNPDRVNEIPLVRLAINVESETFAVAIPHFESKDASNTNSRGTRYFMKASSTVSIFDPYHPHALSQSTTANVILTLISARDGKGYLALDSTSSIRLLTPKAPKMPLPTFALENAPQLLVEDESDAEAEESRKDGNALVSLTAEAEEALLSSSTENDKPVVRPEQLQHVFDLGPSHAMPPVKDLFNAVVGLYARKPRAASAA